MFSKYRNLFFTLFITLTTLPLFQANNQEQPDSSSIQQQKSSGFGAKVVAITGWTLATALGITAVWYYKKNSRTRVRARNTRRLGTNPHIINHHY